MAKQKKRGKYRYAAVAADNVRLIRFTLTGNRMIAPGMYGLGLRTQAVTHLPRRYFIGSVLSTANPLVPAGPAV